MEDIAPQLIQAVVDEFHRLYDGSAKIRTLLEKVKKGNATYTEAQDYALEVSRLIGQAYEKHVSSANLPDGKMYYNIASRLIPETLDENYALVSQYAASVQNQLNKNAGIGLRAQTADKEQDRIDGLVDLASNADQYDDVANQLLPAFENFCLHIVDSTIQKNADFHYRSGLTPKIIRKSHGKCCAWCRALVGEYDYPDVPRDVYRRHGNCHCTVLYDPADGKRKRQNVHTKKWTSDADYVKLEKRKKAGAKSLVDDLIKHPMRLASFSPESLKTAMEQDGYEVKPLKQGSLKGIPFEDGGGFKVNFEDGGLFQYHPDTNSHHGGAYYKISTGTGGTKRYALDGTEKPDDRTKK